MLEPTLKLVMTEVVGGSNSLSQSNQDLVPDFSVPRELPTTAAADLHALGKRAGIESP